MKRRVSESKLKPVHRLNPKTGLAEVDPDGWDTKEVAKAYRSAHPSEKWDPETHVPTPEQYTGKLPIRQTVVWLRKLDLERKKCEDELKAKAAKQAERSEDKENGNASG
jgi:hypothetical protein